MSFRVQSGSVVNGINTVGAAISVAAPGIALSYTCPVGRQAVIRTASYQGNGAGVTYQFRITIGGVTITYASFTAQNTLLQLAIALNAGDVFAINVSVGAAVTADIGIFGEEYLAA